MAYLSLPSTGYHVTTPHTAAMNPGSSTVDMRIRVALTSWASGSNQSLMGSWGANYPPGCQYLLYLDATGHINAAWVDSGASGQFPAATVALGLAAGTVKWVRALITTTIGACDFYTSDDGSSWTSSGTQVTALSSNPVQVPSIIPSLTVAEEDGGASQWTGQVYRAMLLIGGSTICDIDFTQQSPGATSFAATTSETWTISSPAIIVSDSNPLRQPVPFTRGAGGGGRI